MNSPFGWALPVLALIATIVAVLAGPNGTLAVPAASAAVAAAGLALWRTLRRPGSAVSDAALSVPALSEASVDGLEPTEMDPDAVVLLLDRIERARWDPGLRTRTSFELSNFRSLPEAEFLDYVERRLDELEARA